MSGRRSSTIARRVLVIGAAALTAGLLGAGMASASVSVNQQLNWNGTFPIIGNLDPILTTTTTTLPSPVTHGVQSASFPVSVAVDAPPLATTGLEDVGAATLQGTAAVTVTATDSAGKQYTEQINLTIPSTPTPADGSDLTFTATGTATIPAITNTGSLAVSVSGASTTLDPKDANGNDTVLGTFTVALSLDATGPSSNPTNNTALGTIQVN
jgi:hypothetical protein